LRIQKVRDKRAMFFLIRRFILVLLTLALLPVLLVLSATLLFFNLVHGFTRFTRSCRQEKASPLSGLATLIILNWNGKDLLAQGLPSVIAAVETDGRPHEILVVDNGSQDGSVEFVRKYFPQVRLLELPENLGFAEGNNAGVREARRDVVVLLNNDMVVEPGFLRPLLDGFGPGTFAVSSQIFLQDKAARREETGKTAAYFRRGMIDYTHLPVMEGKCPRPYYPVFYAGGGSSAFHRKRFLALGGFQEIYSPAYVEDTDLSYQAWKAGFEVLFAPASVVYHKHRASSSRRFSALQLQVLIQKNQFLFIWKNLRSWRLLGKHTMLLPWNCYRLARDHGIGIWLSLARAIAALPSVQIAKLGARCRGVRSDQEIFELFSKPGIYFTQDRKICRPAKVDEADGAGRPRILWMTAYLPHQGRHAGAGRMFQLLARISRKYRITLLSFIETDEEKEFLPEVEALCETVVAMRRVPPPRWQLYPYEPFDEFRTHRMQEALAGCLEDRDYSLMQFEYTQMACYADKAYGIPSVLTKHEVDFAACLRRAVRERGMLNKLRWFYNFLQVMDREVKLQRRVTVSVCMTEPDAATLRQYCSSVPARVINTGVDLDYFQPPENAPRGVRLVFVGAFQHMPNVEAMVYFCSRILPQIRSAVPEVKLTIVGSKPTPEIVSLGNIPGVSVTGFVPDIRPYMEESSVYVVPLRLGVGIRGKILEAWAMAMPVVATSVACAGLRFRDGENLYLADSPRDFADRTIRLLRDPGLRRDMGLAGRKVAEQHYGWDAAANQLECLYKELISRRNETAAKGTPA
jgi:O-antigen biosynthesis protein